MKRTWMAAIAFLAAGTARGQDSIPEKTLSDLKAATVFVKVESLRWKSTGSGFLFKVEGDVGYIATNEHVINAEGAKASISVVFHSGTKQEKFLVATIVGADDSRDLAVLKITDKGLPKALDPATRVKPRETLPVYMLGFPFGEALSSSKGNPAITVGKGSISSIRLNDAGELERIQIDGDLNPGNSGGPIVDAKGALVGVAVAKIGGTQIGLAIPPEDLEAMLLARVKGVSFTEVENKESTVKMKAVVDLIDPMGKMKSVAVAYVPKDKVKSDVKPDDKGLWPAAATGMTEVALKIVGTDAAGEFTVKGDGKTAEGEYLFQLKYVRGDGKVIYTQPDILRVDFAKGMAQAPEKPGPKKDDGDWLGSDEDKKKRAATEAGKPVETGEELAGKTETVVDAESTSVKLKAETLIPNMIWSDDGKFVYTLEDRGVIRKIAVPGLKEERQFSVGRTCSWIERSKEGLLVAVKDLQEIWVLDIDKLTVKKRIVASGVWRLASSPALTIAFSSSGDENLLQVIDLVKGEAVSQISARAMQQEQGGKIKKHKNGVVLSDFEKPTVTPDGKYLFCEGFECLHRFKIDGQNLVYEEMGPRIGQNASRIEISPDSKYVSLPSGGGNYIIADHPKMTTYGTYIYKVTDISMPVITIESGPYPRTIGYDKTAGKIYAQNSDHNLITFTVKGLKEKEYDLDSGRNEPLQMLVHPDGNRLFVLTVNNLFWVVLPK